MAAKPYKVLRASLAAKCFGLRRNVRQLIPTQLNLTSAPMLAAIRRPALRAAAAPRGAGRRSTTTDGCTSAGMVAGITWVKLNMF